MGREREREDQQGRIGYGRAGTNTGKGTKGEMHIQGERELIFGGKERKGKKEWQKWREVDLVSSCRLHEKIIHI